MKNFLLFIIVLSFIIISSEALALPTIENINLQPQNSFCIENLCDDVLISLNCTDSNYSISQVFGHIASPVISQDMSFSFSDNLYSLLLPNYFFFK